MYPYKNKHGFYRHPSDAGLPPPQSPFDMAYGSSLLPRQLLVGSPFVQVQSPLPSPIHQLRSHQDPYVSSSSRRLRPRIITPSKSRPKTCSPSATSSPALSSPDSSFNDSSSDLHQPADYFSAVGHRSSSSSSFNALQRSASAPSIAAQLLPSKQPTRSLLLLYVNNELPLTKFLDTITFGPIETVRLLENYPEEGYNSIVLSFLKIETCLNFYNNILTYLSKFKQSIGSPDLTINFILARKILPHISNAVNNDGATRNVYIGDLESLGRAIDENYIREQLSKYGIIDKVDLVNKQEGSEKEGTFAFIHFTNIASAIKAVEQLSLIAFWSGCKIFYGTDRCSLNNENRIKSITDENDLDENDDILEIGNHNLDTFIEEEEEEEHRFDQSYASDFIAPQSIYPQQLLIPQQVFNAEDEVSRALNQKALTAAAVAKTSGGVQNIGNRTLYLGNLDSSTKVEDICNVVRGGILQYIKFFPEKRICFITFIEPTAAAQFFANGNVNSIVLRGRKLKIGWGNHSGALPTSIGLAVTVGASRNIYIGVKDEDLDENDNPKVDLPKEEQLRKDFEKFGDVEQINYFKNNRCVFINFLNISNAIKVIEDANGDNASKFHKYFDDRYVNFKINFAKDRCGNPPKTKKKRKNRKGRSGNGASEDKLQEQEQEQEQDEELDGSVVHTEEEVPADLFAQMGITTSNDENDQDFTESPAPLNAASSEVNGEQEAEADYDSASSKSNELTISGILNLSTPKPQSKPSKQKKADHIGNGHYSPSFSPRVFSDNSIASMNYYPEPPQQHYYHQHPRSPFMPPQVRSMANSRTSSRSHLDLNSLNSYPSALFTTSGSEVMAQFLAQSQHANLVYAANVLSSVDPYQLYDEDYYVPSPMQSSAYNSRRIYKNR